MRLVYDQKRYYADENDDEDEEKKPKKKHHTHHHKDESSEHEDEKSSPKSSSKESESREDVKKATTPRERKPAPAEKPKVEKKQSQPLLDMFDFSAPSEPPTQAEAKTSATSGWASFSISKAEPTPATVPVAEIKRPAVLLDDTVDEKKATAVPAPILAPQTVAAPKVRFEPGPLPERPAPASVCSPGFTPPARCPTSLLSSTWPSCNTR